ncbi:MAG TPA: SDR family NAD(P)-dependent oxidoreductase, partial [Acidimicrobiales bacterium]|nr:SDR family NAD(P)-dependent oxidoreductase [Acidimicrobiales bacterium]
MGLLEGKVVLLSGGASDIGRATALELARQGAAVAVGDVDAPGAEATARAVASAGGLAVSGSCDLRDDASVRAFVALTVRELGGVDGLDHNAAWS